MAEWLPTYDTFRTREAAAKDAARRNQEAKANGSGRQYVIKKYRGSTYTVMYHEKGD